jgi:hypothetical protein
MFILKRKSRSPLFFPAMLLILLTAWPWGKTYTNPISVMAAVLDVNTALYMLPDWVSEGGDQGVEYGASVASAGDINNDGFMDVVVGAWKYYVNDERSGSAFVFLGGPSGLSQSLHKQLSPTEPNSYFGFSVCGAGDVNGDGFDDILVGAPNHRESELESIGSAHLYLGSAAGINESAAWSKVGFGRASQFGSTVCGVGDVNNDGFDDVLIAAITLSNPEINEGGVYLFLGSALGLANDPAWMMEGNQSYAVFGYALAGLGDLNHDGYADFAVSAPSFQNGMDEEQKGKVWVFYGADDVSSLTSSWSAEGNQYDARFGSAVDSAGDVNGDGYLDLIVGARGYDDDLTDNGAAFVFYNNNGELNPTPNWMDSGSQEFSGYGISVAGLGDVNEDGYGDIAVGAHFYSDDQSKEGAVFVYRGSPVGAESFPNWQANGNKADTEFGYAIAAAGLINNDTKADLIVGAPTYKKDEKIVMGSAYVFLGAEASEVFIHQAYLPMLLTGH